MAIDNFGFEYSPLKAFVQSRLKARIAATPTPKPPVITSALTLTATQNIPFSYQIVATNMITANKPLSYNAVGLPSGVVVNTTTGLISGSTPTVATFNVTISATNAYGTGSAVLVLTVNILNIVACSDTTGLVPIKTSVDGSNWVIPATSPENNNWYSVAYSPSLGLFCVVGDKNVGTYSVMTSPDGNTWTKQTAGVSDTTWRSVVWSPEKSLFVAVGKLLQGGTGTNVVMTSPDGKTWTAQSSGAGPWYGVTWSKEKSLFVAVGPQANTMSSPDGVTWSTNTNSIANQTWNAVSWSAAQSLFIAVNSDGVTGAIAKSSNGTSWSTVTLGAAAVFYSCVWSSVRGLFIASGSSYIYTSSDGSAWTSRTAPAGETSRAICWSAAKGLFVLVGTSFGSGRVSTYSSDGITWTLGTSLDSSNEFLGVISSA